MSLLKIAESSIDFLSSGSGFCVFIGSDTDLSRENVDSKVRGIDRRFIASSLYFNNFGGLTKRISSRGAGILTLGFERRSIISGIPDDDSSAETKRRLVPFDFMGTGKRFLLMSRKWRNRAVKSKSHGGGLNQARMDSISVRFDIRDCFFFGEPFVTRAEARFITISAAVEKWGVKNSSTGHNRLQLRSFVDSRTIGALGKGKRSKIVHVIILRNNPLDANFSRLSLARMSTEPESKTVRPGVVYLPTLPPYMNAQKLRHLLEKFASIGRIYLTPEDPTKYANRVKSGGCKKECFTEGWVEFADKQDAKRVAKLLNAQPVGGKKRHNFYHDDIWCIRYLNRFTWNDLMEHRVYQKQVSQKRLQTLLSKQKKDDEFFLEAVSKKKEMDSAELRRQLEGKEPVAKKARKERSLPRQKHAFVAKTTETGGDLLEALAM